ncbi:MAG: DNA polymerase III subunit gamma and tau [Microbacteriaceae bacterium]|nr:DNA polymerase III subunit gamma and tau [Microbacteriaceae bacterium]MCI1207094.1 DNA polymerase III subunit gamma and tau [Microbacteriaceae bacterium]
MVTALYRRYRPDTFADLIGQEQVTGPLRAALRNNRVNHAYLFSGPRGCGKTTSARILARCLNCAKGPTDTPCGTCPSCRELATGGPGSLDVIEIDAASHNGVDDARELRERAVFAPARDRYKIFILDEAHMVTPQGFNALLKLVEEPPDHVKFIFATTEPDKVIGTIRSRTHHYPFRLIPASVMLPYVQKLLDAEQVSAEPGVLPLVVRAGGGSVRDTLSVLDQLIAGSEDSLVRYDTTIGLLGYTPARVLSGMLSALSQHDAAGLFTAVDSLMQTGQDPRSFVEDLLQRLRDATLAVLTGDAATDLLHGMSAEEIADLRADGQRLGVAGLDRAAQVVDQTLSTMGGSLSPRTQVELMCARLLLTAAPGEATGPANASQALAAAPAAPALAAHTPPAEPAQQVPASTSAPAHQAHGAAAPSSTAPAANAAPPVTAAAPATTPVAPTGPLTAAQITAAWPQILEAAQRRSRLAWMVIKGIQVDGLTDDILALRFDNSHDEQAFRGASGNEKSVEVLRDSIHEILGVRLRFIARLAPGRPAAPAPATAPTPAPTPAPHAPHAPEPRNGQVSAPTPTSDAAPKAAAPQAPADPGASTAPGTSDGAASPTGPAHPTAPAHLMEPPAEPEPEPWAEEGAWPEEQAAAPQPPANAATPGTTPQQQEPAAPQAPRRHHPKYGEAVIREILKAKPVEKDD